MNKIPLSVRLERVSKLYPSDPDYVVSCIYSMADIPISSYLSEQSFERLQELLGVPPDMPYKKVAEIIFEIHQQDQNNAVAAESIRLLAGPFLRCITAERRNRHTNLT